MKKKETIVVSAFPGTGKSFAFENCKDYSILDSDSSQFSWADEEKKERHPDWPGNYMEHIKENIGEVDFIFVSTHREVRGALAESGIPYIIMVPYMDDKKEYMERFKDRGSPKDFRTLLDHNWDNWITECLRDYKAQARIVLQRRKNILDVLPRVDKSMMEDSRIWQYE